jgi:cytochrome c oxidase subunit 2
MLNIILTVVFIALFYTVVLLLAKINERVRDFKGEGLDYVKLSKSNSKYFALFGIAFIGFFAFCFNYLKYASLPVAASITGQKIDNLFLVTAIITGVVFLLCHIALFAFVYLYYQRKDRKAVFFAHSSTLEIIWTSVPALTMTVLVIMGLNVWFQVFPNAKKAPVNPLNIEVTGKQFNWIVRYPGPDGKLGRRLLTKENVTQDNELGIDWSDPASHDDFFASEIHLIKDKPVLFNLSALDVLHSFYLPHFRMKMDCVPGVPTSIGLTPIKTNDETREELKSNPYWASIDPETNEPRFNKFTYELACAELCGKSHYGMQVNVKVESKSEFDKWMATQKPYFDQVKEKLESSKSASNETATKSVSGDSTKMVSDSLKIAKK